MAIVNGTAGSDALGGTSGPDTISGLAGDDMLVAGDGGDTLDGGAGFDTVNYVYAPNAVAVDLAIIGPQSTGFGRDTLISIEHLLGSQFSDLLLGSAAANYVDAGDGNDTVYGRAGDDDLRGGNGDDTLYGGDGKDVVIGNAGSDTLYGEAGDDTLHGLEDDDVLRGGDGKDVLDGGDGNDSLFGDAGDDTLIISAGVDSYNGGDGVDTISFASAWASISINLAATGVQALGVGTGILISIENLIGTALDDTLAGDAGNNRLEGGLGDDVIQGGLGDDFLDGGAGLDTVDFSLAANGVKVSLALAGAQKTGVGTDTLSHFEILRGSAFGDELTGDALVNTLSGLKGDDVLQGGGGDDVLVGGEGVDTAKYAGLSRNYKLDLTAAGWTVRDLMTSDGIDSLSGVERLQFSDKTIVIDVGLPVAVQKAYGLILREMTWTDATSAFAKQVAAHMSVDKISEAAAIAEIVARGDETTSVASMNYQFFTGKVPSGPGLDYLVAAGGSNPNSLNSTYFQTFNMGNRYINFAVNLGRDGEGRAAFAEAYQDLSMFESTRLAYKTIFGAAPTDEKIHAMIDPRIGFLAICGGDGPEGLGTKAAMVGWLLAEAEKADLGVMALSNNAWLTDLADDSAAYGVNVVGAYGKPEYVFGG